MKVLINAFSAKRGGILTYTGNLLRSLAERGIEVVAGVPPTFDLPDGIEGIRVPVADFHPARRFLWEQTVWPILVRRVRPDLLFSSANFGLLRSPVPQLLLMREGGLFDPFYLSHVSPNQGLRLALWRVLRRRLMRLSVTRADHVMTPSQAMKDLLTLWLPACADKITANRYGALDDVFVQPTWRRTWREDGVLRILYVSVYYPHKAPGDVCRLVEILEQAGIPSHATITMTVEEIQNWPGSTIDLLPVQRLSQAGKLTLGRTAYERLPDLYANHDVFVFPAVAETFGHPLAEAMSAGIPVVASDTPVAREVCGDGALYVPPFRPKAFANRVQQLDADPNLRRTLVEGARRHVLSNLRWNDHVDRLIDLFERVLR
jgi:glycosyltransferase involved in cell wall biosynthesis